MGDGSAGRKGLRVLQDLAALTPPLVVCAAFLIGLIMFLRRQMSTGKPADPDRPADITDDTGNDAAGGAPPPPPPPGITR